MIKTHSKWMILGVGFLVWACATIGAQRGFRFTPLTQDTFPEVEQATLYRHSLGRPHRVIGEVTILGRPGETMEPLEKCLLEAAGKVGAQGVIVVETDQTLSEIGKAGVRNDNVGGASKQYRYYPSPVMIEEDRIYIRGLAIRFLGA